MCGIASFPQDSRVGKKKAKKRKKAVHVISQLAIEKESPINKKVIFFSSDKSDDIKYDCKLETFLTRFISTISLIR